MEDTLQDQMHLNMAKISRDTNPCLILLLVMVEGGASPLLIQILVSPHQSVVPLLKAFLGKMAQVLLKRQIAKYGIRNTNILHFLTLTKTHLVNNCMVLLMGAFLSSEVRLMASAGVCLIFFKQILWYTHHLKTHLCSFF